MDPEQAKRIANQCWQSGTAAVNKKNFDYAVEQFSTAAKLVPDNLVYRQTLRGAEYAMYDNNGSGARMSGAKLMGVRGRVKKARGKEDWKTMNEEAESGLKVNPWDAQLEAWVGEACVNLGFQEIGIFAYSNAVKNDKENVTYLKALAELYEGRHEYDAAINLWEKIHQLNPDDGEARSKQTQLQAEKTTYRGGYEDAKSTKDVKAGQNAYDDKKSAGLPNDAIGPGDDPESDLKRQIR
ncbi:MAG: tetratricopeptide repeat protein, partial [Planctomycetaceae bacterium]|nr:tetratricopeptide repeat protein [Planctomycetaceae bacterium]